MDTIQSVFYQVANGTKPVSFFIDILTKEECEIPQDEKSAYQAFCCALLARNEKKLMQKGQYVKEYDLFIQKSFSINPDCIVGRLIRMMIEKKLENVLFVNHFDSDSQFLSQRLHRVKNDNIVELINKTIA